MFMRKDEPFKVARVTFGDGPGQAVGVYAFPAAEMGTPTVGVGNDLGYLNAMTPRAAEELAAGLIKAAKVARGGVDTEATPQQKLDFLASECRDAMAVLDRMELPAYFDAVERSEPHALALLTIYDLVRGALNVLGYVPNGERVADRLTAAERATVEKLKATPLKDIHRQDAFDLLEIVNRLAPPLPTRTREG